jgi:hypothetical protein
MSKYRDSMAAFELGKCIICKELWPTRAKDYGSLIYKCSVCKKDPIKFSSANDMDPEFEKIPHEIRKLLSECTLVEEMLISPVIPVMKVSLESLTQSGYPPTQRSCEISWICR